MMKEHNNSVERTQSRQNSNELVHTELFLSSLALTTNSHRRIELAAAGSCKNRILQEQDRAGLSTHSHKPQAINHKPPQPAIYTRPMKS